MRSVLITGASRGIGACCAELFAASGYRVYINYNKSADKALALLSSLSSRGYEAYSMQADISREDDVSRLVGMCEYRGGIDVLINNAGVSYIGTLEQTEKPVWDDIISTDLTGTYLVTRHALPVLKNSDSGRIINISSVWGTYGASCEVAYSAAKAGAIGFTKALAKELGPSKITVNCIAPGYIDTEMNAAHTEATVKDIIERTPLCRLGTAQDVANAVLFFAHVSSGFITGQTLGVDGGFC